MEDLKVFRGKTSGPKVAIMAATHGDEPAGVKALEFLNDYFEKNPLDAGEVKLVIGNPAAFKLNKRGVTHDINRLYLLSDDELLAGGEDHRRALEVKKILADSDYLLDLHTTGNPSVPFSIAFRATEEEFKILRTLPADFCSFGWDDKIVGTAVEWFKQKGGLAVVVECGCHNDLQGETVATATAQQFLNYFGLTNFATPSLNNNKALKVLLNEPVRDKETFNYSKTYINFDPVAPGELIAEDSEHQYFAPDLEDLVIIFPTKLEGIRNGTIGEAYLLGQFTQLPEIA